MAPCSLAFLTAAAHSAESCQAIIDRYSSLGAIQAALEQARVLAEVEMNELEISNPQLKDFQTLLSLLVFPSSALRASPERLAANQKGQPGLWPFAISGDYPILLAEIGDRAGAYPGPGAAPGAHATGAGASS